MMKKYSPVFDDDSDIYFVSKNEINFALNARKLLDFSCGERFNEKSIKLLNVSVGFYGHSVVGSTDDDLVLEKFFLCLKNSGVNHLYAIPTGYCHSSENERAMEVVDYDPPLIAKIKPTYEQFGKIRGGQIGLYAQRSYLFSPCLGYALLDLNGHYSLIMGPKSFVENVLGATIEDSWSSVWGGVADPSFVEKLRKAAAVYSKN